MSAPKVLTTISSSQNSKKTMERIEIHSAEMQEVIGRMPHWMISSGITLIFAVVMILLAGSWLFNFPDVVTATVTLTTQNPPADVTVRNDGKLQHLLVKDGQKVSAGEYLGVLQSSADLASVLELKKVLPRLQEFSGSFEPKTGMDPGYEPVLGEMQNSYEIFLKNYVAYIRLKMSPKGGKQRSKLRLELKLSFNDLWEAIGQWESKHVLQAPFAGKVAFTRFWSNHQNVTAGDKVFIVKPEESGEWIGRLLLPARSSAKVRVGQRVRVKLGDYPFLEFGFLWGEIGSRSQLPAGANTKLEICFPAALKTTQGKTLPLNHGMQGTAEIITENKRLLERLFSPFQLLLKQKSRGVEIGKSDDRGNTPYKG